MKLPWQVEKKIGLSETERQIEQVKNILFPKLELRQQEDKDGDLFKFHIDYSVDSNLEAALTDLQDGHNDRATQKTINTCIDKLNMVRRLLEAYAEFDPDAKYIIVDDNAVDNDDIVPADFS